MRFPVQAVDALAMTIIQRDTSSRRVWNRRFASFFVIPQYVVSELWGLLTDQGNLPQGFRPIHLLWTLCFLKLYSPEVAMATLLGCHEDTMRKWVWVGIHLIKELDLVSFVTSMMRICIYLYESSLCRTTVTLPFPCID